MTQRQHVVAHLEPGRRWALMLRHAERPEIPTGGFGYDLPLTEEGYRQASEIGGMLGGRLGELATRAVPRCVHTAQAIREGASARVPIKTDWRLGDPGVWVMDGDVIGDVFLTLGPQEVVRRHLSARRVPGLRAIDEGTRILLDWLLRGQEEEDCVDIFVSHDAVIAPLLGHLLMTDNVDAIWPDFLEGVLLASTDEGIELVWRDRKYLLADGGGRWRVK